MIAMDGVVLVIDTLEYGQKKVKPILEGTGNFSIVEISSKILFSAILKDIKDVTLIILDIEFPNVNDGFEVLSKIRGNVYTAEAPIIITTNLDLCEYKTACLEYNVNDYIVKPYKPERLRNSILSIVKIQKEFEYDFTGIVNVTLSFEEYMSKELKYSVRTNTPFSMIVIRHEKPKFEIYEKYFDENSQMNIPEKIRNGLRSTDTVFLNTNGDMFILLPSTDSEKAKMASYKIEEILKGIISETGKRFSDQFISVFVTFPEDGDGLNNLLKNAIKKIENKKALEAMTSILVSAQERGKIAYNQYKKI